MVKTYYNGFSPEQRNEGERIVKKAIASGEIPKPSELLCRICGQDKGVRHYHQEDYSPERVIEASVCLCFRCHMMWHRRIKNPEPSFKYFYEVIVNKKRFEPVYQRNFND